MMNVRYQLPANVALFIVMFAAGFSTLLVMRAIQSISFEGLATERAQILEEQNLN